jgi:general secretion pathway protein J
MRSARGFTLIEVVVALSLLAFGLALTFGTLRGATKATERAEATAQRSERLRAVQSFIRGQVSGALSIAYAIEESTGEPTFFRVDAHTLEFVAGMPGYLASGGPYLQTLELVPGEGGLQLVFQYRLLMPDGPLDAEREPEVLLEGIAEGGFEIRALDEKGEPLPWQPEWKAYGQLPALLRVNLRFADTRMRWPELLIPLRSAEIQPGQSMPGARASDARTSFEARLR